MDHAVKATKFKTVAKHVSANVDNIQHVFSVDVEEWFQVGAFENAISRDDWPELESRVVLQTERIL